LRQAIHVDRGAFALVFAGHRLEQVDGAVDIALDGGLRGGVIELLDFLDRVHGPPLYGQARSG